ncbi:unnamed protein product [Camellia sinensis]
MSGEFWFGRATSRTMILDKGQLLETEQMFRDAGGQWPVIIPEEEIRQAAPGTKNVPRAGVKENLFKWSTLNLRVMSIPSLALYRLGT